LQSRKGMDKLKLIAEWETRSIDGFVAHPLYDESYSQVKHFIFKY